MKGRRRFIVILIIFLLLISGLFLTNYFLSRTKFNDSYVNGSTAGNLYNSGLFCESSGTVFFSNPADGHKLYSMDTSGGKLTKLADDAVSYINADEHYVYYVRDNGSLDAAFSFLKFSNNSLCRIDRNGKHFKILDNDPSLYASLFGNYIYYIHYDKSEASTLYRIKIDGEEREQISKIPYLTCASDGQLMYFNGEQTDHKLWQLDTSSNSFQTLHDCVCYEPAVINGYAYYMDGEQNYAIVRLDLSTNETTLLVKDRVDCYNIYGDTIYYQKNDEAVRGLYRCGLDGTGEELVAEGNYTAIHATSSFIYFYDYNNDTRCYKTPANGAVSVSVFQP